MIVGKLFAKAASSLLLLFSVSTHNAMAAQPYRALSAANFFGQSTTGEELYIHVDQTIDNSLNYQAAFLYLNSVSLGKISIDIPVGSLQIHGKGAAEINATLPCGTVSIRLNGTGAPTLSKSKTIEKSGNSNNTKKTYNSVSRDVENVTGVICGFTVGSVYDADFSTKTLTIND